MIEADTYKRSLEKADSVIASLQKEITRKEGVIVSQIEKNKICYQTRDNLDSQVKNYTAIVSEQKATIENLSKPDKRFGLAIGAGYGYSLSSSAVRAPIVGISLVYNLIRF